MRLFVIFYSLCVAAASVEDWQMLPAIKVENFKLYNVNCFQR
jgi:hypothetical protein